jgi:hypothetical protein
MMMIDVAVFQGLKNEKLGRDHAGHVAVQPCTRAELSE